MFDFASLPLGVGNIINSMYLPTRDISNNSQIDTQENVAQGIECSSGNLQNRVRNSEVNCVCWMFPCRVNPHAYESGVTNIGIKQRAHLLIIPPSPSHPLNDISRVWIEILDLNYINLDWRSLLCD